MMRIAACAMIAALFVTGCADEAKDSGGPSAAELSRDYVLSSATPGWAIVPDIFEGEQPQTPLQPASASVVDRLNAGLGATYMARYRTAAPDGEPGDVYIVFQKPPFTRVDLVPAGGSEPTSTTIARSDGETASCSRSGGGYTCSAVPPLGPSPLLAVGPVVYPAPSDLAASEPPSPSPTEIAGRAAECVELRATAARPPLQYCIDSAGVVLRNAGDFGVVDAVEYSLSVSDDVFLLPE